MFDNLSTDLRRLSQRVIRQSKLSKPSRLFPDLNSAAWARPQPFPDVHAPPDGVTEITAFGSNPGGLRMQLYVPRAMPRPGCSLLVLLHGCGQDGPQLAQDAGWIRLADMLRAPLLLPMQTAENNQGRCFNWFLAADRERGKGEAQSIREMVEAASRRFHPDPRRIFIAGLSAGGAQAAAMLAAYPDVFSAGAIVAGLPVNVAFNVRTALALMAGQGEPVSGEAAAGLARALGPAAYAGTWPRISLWHGDADHTVVPANSEVLAGQWLGLHRLGPDAVREDQPSALVHRRRWGSSVRPSVESWTVRQMGHGYPVAAGPVSDRFVLPVGIDATGAIGRFFDG
ncbi:MAG TPA: PHB depolymerase family esterase [Acetobacteraceae bacterium]|jgi:poly(hydroxyalkanoate) depolymerase family esterase|nr:PHB depolymerase family esterase [Acetobacteraceae bacterium]